MIHFFEMLPVPLLTPGPDSGIHLVRFAPTRRSVDVGTVAQRARPATAGGAWMPGTSPGMTTERVGVEFASHYAAQQNTP